MENKGKHIIDGIMLILAIVLFIGSQTVFHGCDPNSGGTFMMCHWAEQAVIGIGGVLIVTSLMRFFVSNEVKIGLSLATIPMAILAGYLPKNLIPLCKMETMACHTIFRPSVILLTAFIIIFAVIDIIRRRKNN